MMRAPSGTRAFPGDKMLPALEATLADLGVDLHAQANVHLDVEQRENKSPRAFCSPIEVPGKVMLVIQPIGGPDDWSALFHEAGHTEHFAHTTRRPRDGVAPPRRQRGHRGLRDAPPAPRRRARLAAPPARLPAPERVRRRGRRRAPLLRAPLLREAPVRAGVPREPPSRRRCAALRRAPRRRAQDRAQPDGLPRRHRPRLLRLLVPALVGARGAAPPLPARRSSATSGSPPARPARSCASCGARASAGRPRRCSARSPARSSRSSRSRSASASTSRWRRTRRGGRGCPVGGRLRGALTASSSCPRSSSARSCRPGCGAACAAPACARAARARRSVAGLDVGVADALRQADRPRELPKRRS